MPNVPNYVVFPPWTLNGLIPYSAAIEKNLTNFDRKQVLSVLSKVCVFRADPSTKMTAWTPIGWNIFYFSSVTINRNLTQLESKQALNVFQ